MPSPLTGKPRLWVPVIFAAVVLVVTSAPWGSVGARPVAPSTGCGTPNRSPSAVMIAGPVPGSGIRSGGSIGVTYSIAVANASAGSLPASVYVPSVTAVFPLKPTGSLTVFVRPKTASLTGAGWSNAANVSQIKSVASDLNFRPSTPPFLTTQKIAVMADAPYGQLTLEVRWRWIEVTSAGAGSTNGSWTVPNGTATSPYLPSLFWPAPYVRLVRTNGTSLASGSNFSAELSGAVSNTSFRVVLEYPTNGTEITSQWESNPANETYFNATARLAFPDGTPIPAGKYLVHIHDGCQAIVHSISVAAT